MKNWLVLFGAALAVYGVFRMVSGVWGPDAIISAGPNNMLISGVIIAVGAVLIIVSRFIKDKSQ